LSEEGEIERRAKGDDHLVIVDGDVAAEIRSISLSVAKLL
jgi:hypothetical protein